MAGAALASGWRYGRKGGWGGTRRPQTVLMWVEEFRPDLVVMCYAAFIGITAGLRVGLRTFMEDRALISK